MRAGIFISHGACLTSAARHRPVHVAMDLENRDGSNRSIVSHKPEGPLTSLVSAGV